MKTVVIDESFLKIFLRKELADRVVANIKDLQDFTKAEYFDHHIIKNYYKKDFTISSIMTNSDWQDLYWKEYWHNDPLERKVYKNAKINGSSVSLWSVCDNDSDCMIARKKTCHVNDGVTICYTISPFVMESFSLAWSKKDGKNVSSDFLKEIETKISNIRNFHFDNFYLS
ncbi:MAG: hypothetical protein HEEMFOPI_01511 [Holosporales bacterium]